MGKYAQRISERIRNTRIEEGFCLICGGYGKLSKDHVPPQGAITITAIEQKHITEAMGTEKSHLKGVVSQHGSTFKTICIECNNERLGKNDSEVSRVCKELTNLIKTSCYNYDGTYRVISIKCDILKFSRAIIGHILAATTVAECRLKPSETEYFSPLQRFVMGNNNALNDSHDIYYWYYPRDIHLSAKMVGYNYRGNGLLMSLLAFFPIAFLIVEKGKGVYPRGAHKLVLDNSNEFLFLDMSMKESKYIDFPFSKIDDYGFYLLNDSQCIISYPIRHVSKQKKRG